jgi:hypothetical protein
MGETMSAELAPFRTVPHKEKVNATLTLAMDARSAPLAPSYHRDVVLEFLLHMLDLDTRGKLMATHPVSYWSVINERG